MREVDPSPKLQAMLKKFDELGGVVDFARFDLEGEDGNDLETHRQAAMLTVKAPWLVDPGIKPELMRAERIDVDRFLGPYFDPKGRRLLLRGTTEQTQGYAFWAGDPECLDFIVYPPPGWNGDYSTHGLADAFVDPPHGYAGDNELFLQFYDEFFGGFRSESVIYQWSTDWSGYFDHGHEWWGSFCWTVYIVGSGRIVGVAASATD